MGDWKDRRLGSDGENSLAHTHTHSFHTAVECVSGFTPRHQHMWMHTAQLHLCPSLKQGCNQPINWLNCCTDSPSLRYTHSYRHRNIQSQVFTAHMHQVKYISPLNLCKENLIMLMRVWRPVCPLLGSILAFSSCFRSNIFSSCQYHPWYWNVKAFLYRPGKNLMNQMAHWTGANPGTGSSTYRS